ncbi:unnamed protein product [Malus baccata var. baccata]
MKLEISALEHSCFEAKKIQEEETAEENTRMSLLIQDLELFNEVLQEELKEEKLKANEEAEDLAQEMAEFSLFRYTDRMTGLLEEECKRRACIEQASLHRIAELEAQNGPNPLPLSDIFMNAEGSSIPRITWLIFQRQFSLLWLWIDRRIVPR